MASLPIFTVLEQSQVSPPPATVGHRSLPLTFFDIGWLSQPPVHHLFFYELAITKPQFIETIVPTLKRSLSITLQHFFPFVGNLIIFPTRKPEIRHVDGDSVAVTFAESNLDFHDLTGNHARDCGSFYPLIPVLGHAAQASADYVSITVFSVQVTVFPGCGISIGMTNHHCLGDASTRSCFLKAWTSIARSGTDESFLGSGALPLYDRVIKQPTLDEIYLKQANIGTFTQEYQPASLSGPTNNVRATFVLTRPTINRLKKRVSNQLPSLQYVSSFTVACAYIWSCMAKIRGDELQVFGFVIDCRSRLVPAIPATYFGNCVAPCGAMARTTVLSERDGFVTAARLLGESLHEKLTDKDGILKDAESWYELSFGGVPDTIMGVAGTPKIRFYDTDFGWGKPRKYEIISIDYNGSISMNACKDSNEDLEIGVCLSATEMKAFVSMFNCGLE
ncbi:malonyl-coenzyme A:anthocyanin 3-O-glucoside-6''-O-malonyltransferase [Cynara cardunculus var. scolymus]|uniref:Chloramphenicol acetyltransferase-like domain-containing protein n=1 Tax=Cynara cardunculus var. scolymus TaxID=59895 RepID=A0A124SFT2_CYNCS|nr:malonyl-coenzyme A:anthocyanin 3-O-glucoside-6''-O-malonyltransferase [Cynara cardunculus var. scolymus]KVI04201.1 Chloramphenicol acetyltransferase-like domain-containing protein [Cynara cardunculus var. scolymus]